MKYFSYLITLLVLTASNTGWGYQYYYFHTKELDLSNASFNQYVLPQLRTINQEFYNLLKRSFPLQNEVISIKKHIASMQETWEVGSQRCLKQEPHSQCDQLLIKLKKDSRELEQLVSTFQKNKLNSKDIIHDRSVVDRVLGISEFIDQVTLTNYLLQHKLENRIIDQSSVDALKRDHFSKHSIQNLLNNLGFYSQILIIDLIDKDYRDLYESLWENFVKPIELQVIPSANQKYLINNLDKLNIGWSSFHHKMERGNLNVAPSTLNSISTMRTRWNEILKLYLKNTTFFPSDKIKSPTM